MQCTVHQECLQRRRELGIAIVNTSGVLRNNDLTFMCTRVGKLLRETCEDLQLVIVQHLHRCF